MDDILTGVTFPTPPAGIERKKKKEFKIAQNGKKIGRKPFLTLAPPKNGSEKKKSTWVSNCLKWSAPSFLPYSGGTDRNRHNLTRRKEGHLTGR